MAIYYGEHELSFNNHEEMLLLPVNPDVTEVGIAGNSTTWHTTEVGDFKAIGFPALSTLTISSFFPNHNYPFCTYATYPSPEECVALIRKWQDSKRPIRYINTDNGNTIINEAYSIENFQYTKEMGTGDIYFELTLEQYRFSDEINRQEGSVEVGDKLMIVVTLVKGQTLGQLAEEWLGDSDRWKEIADYNKLPHDGHPWKATEKNFHQIEIVCERGTIGYKRIKEMKAYG